MQRAKARQVIDLLTSASAQVAEALDLVRNEMDAKDFGAQAKATGEVLGWMSYHLMRPIVREYPELDPDGADSKSTS